MPILLRLIRALFLSVHLWRDYRLNPTTPRDTSIAREFERRKKQERFYKKGKRKRRPSYRLKRYKYTDSRPRDHRFKNQQTLRRMYRNG